jgi:hypothetical protein
VAIDRTARFEITADDRTRAGLQSAVTSFKRTGTELQTAAGKIGGSINAAFAKIGGFQGLAAGAAVAGAALGKVVADSIQFADAIEKGATTTGLATEKFSALAFAAKQSDIDVQALSGALVKLQLATSKAEGGNKQFLATFQALGIDFAKFKGLGVEVKLKEVAEAISRLQKDADRTRGSVELFGESGAKLLPLFKDGAAGIQALEQRATELGLVLGPEAIQRILAADEAMKGSNARITGLKLTLSETVGPLLGDVADGLRTIFGGATEVEKLNTKLEFLQRIASRKLDPIIFNFGYVDGAGLVVGPQELRDEIGRVQTKLADLQKQASGTTFSVGTPQGFGAPEEVTVKAKRLRDGEFADSELNAELGRIRANPRVDRSLDSIFEANRSRYENEAQVLGELSRNLADQQESIFADNSEAISEYLGRIDNEVLSSIETQSSLFEEFSGTIESTLSDAFLNIGEGADGLADGVLNSFKRILADAAAKKVASLLGGLFGGNKDPGVGGGTGSATGGLLSTALGALFGGARAQGGPVEAGKVYVTGEHGSEPEVRPCGLGPLPSFCMSVVRTR